MESCKVRGLVVRRADYGEANSILTLYAEGMGVISACAYGTKSTKSKLRGISQPYAFSEFVLSKKHGDIYRIEAAQIIDSFYAISEDLTALSLANYFCEISREAYEGADARVLALLLNTLYCLAYKKYDYVILKAVFELKLIQYMGYEPCITQCAGCGCKAPFPVFDISEGVRCGSCRRAWDREISLGLYRAIGYILAAEGSKIFAFNVSDEVKKELSGLCEDYLLSKTERSYKSLDYLKKMM